MKKEDLLKIIEKLYFEDEKRKSLPKEIKKMIFHQLRIELLVFFEKNNQEDNIELIDKIYEIYIKFLNMKKKDRMLINWTGTINSFIKSLINKNTRNLFKFYFLNNLENYVLLFENMKNDDLILNEYDEVDLKDLIYVTPDLNKVRDFKLMSEDELPILINLLAIDKKYRQKILGKKTIKIEFLDLFKEVPILKSICGLLIISLSTIFFWVYPMCKIFFDQDELSNSFSSEVHLNINNDNTKIDILHFLLNDSIKIKDVEDLFAFKLETPVAFNESGQLIEFDMYLMSRLY